VSDLTPGDMAVIISHRTMPPFAREYIGLTVVLVAQCEHVDDPYWSPYWHVSGMPLGDRLAVSHKVLRKIPPAPMDDRAEQAEWMALNVALTVAAIERFRERALQEGIFYGKQNLRRP
jgi:hypothetical protein